MKFFSLEGLKPTLLSTTFSTFQVMGLHHVFSPFFSGRGVIFMLHRVIPEGLETHFAPNEYLDVTPESLEQAVDHVLSLDIDIVSLDEAHKRMKEPKAKRFVVFTFDDGYQDMKNYVYPIFKKRNIPFTIYIPSAWPEGEGVQYWALLEKAITQNSQIEHQILEIKTPLDCETTAQKIDVFHQLLDYFMTKKYPGRDPAFLALIDHYNIDAAAYCRELIMDWDEIRELNKDDLVTIGAHSVNHPSFNKLSDKELAYEINHSREKIEQELGEPCLHFSYPFGDKDAIGEREIRATEKAGFLTATTTRRGVVQSDHIDKLCTLPRVNFYGHYQSKGYISLVTSGLPFFVLNKFRRHVAT